MQGLAEPNRYAVNEVSRSPDKQNLDTNKLIWSEQSINITGYFKGFQNHAYVSHLTREQ